MLAYQFVYHPIMSPSHFKSSKCVLGSLLGKKLFTPRELVVWVSSDDEQPIHYKNLFGGPLSSIKLFSSRELIFKYAISNPVSVVLLLIPLGSCSVSEETLYQPVSHLYQTIFFLSLGLWNRTKHFKDTSATLWASLRCQKPVLDSNAFEIL